METKLVKIHQIEESLEEIEEAARLIQQGEVVAFPTETVYGLGGNGLMEEAVRKIYQAKGRPSDNPLILHISDIDRGTDRGCSGYCQKSHGMFLAGSDDCNFEEVRQGSAVCYRRA